MLVKFCDKCGKQLSLSQFLEREDRMGYYSWDVGCMEEQCRESDYPDIRKRGGGSLELEPQD